jgi:hypothetical protein
MRVIFKSTSTNGRWGIEICTESTEEITFPAQGTLTSLGKQAGITAYKFEPGETGQYIAVINKKVEEVEGCRVERCMTRQSSDYTTVLVCGPQAVYKTYTYKDRGSFFTMLINGKEQDAPASILLALGLIESEIETKVVEDAPMINTAFADALKKAGF